MLILHYGLDSVVSTHSRPKAAGSLIRRILLVCTVSTHSRPKAAGKSPFTPFRKYRVSTHSRPKAAGWATGFLQLPTLFQHTAARRRLVPSSVLLRWRI